MWNQKGQPRLPAVDRIQIFYNDDQATKHCSLSLSVLRSGLNSINSRRPWLPLLISHLFNLVSSWSLHFYTQGVFGWDRLTISLNMVHMINHTMVKWIQMAMLQRPLSKQDSLRSKRPCMLQGVNRKDYWHSIFVIYLLVCGWTEYSINPPMKETRRIKNTAKKRMILTVVVY